MLSGKLRAIETVYRSCRFRSRSEARWAVYFDALNAPWHYEPEGFVLPGGEWYLPDFWLPEQGCYFEVKGAPPTEEEKHKAGQLAAGSGKPVHIFHGGIEAPGIYPRGSFGLEFLPGAEEPGPSEWAECPRCHRIGLVYGGVIDCLPCHGCGRHGERVNTKTKRLLHAYSAARMARFDREERWA